MDPLLLDAPSDESARPVPRRGHELPACLRDLDVGDLARISGVEGDTSKRLSDMGFVRGAVLEMVRPGRPCLVRIGGTYVGLGLELQQSVLIERV
jgi:Fe2+ transport system protein FeoA